MFDKVNKLKSSNVYFDNMILNERFESRLIENNKNLDVHVEQPSTNLPGAQIANPISHASCANRKPTVLDPQVA